VWEAWLQREGRETYVTHVDRHYYNRFLTKRLANPLLDAKQLVLFQNVPRGDLATLRRAFDTVADRCAKASLVRVYTAINKGDNWTP
jgi:hypothetical protein